MSEEDDAPLVCTPQAIAAALEAKSPGRSPGLGDMVYVHDGLEWGDKCWRVDEQIEDELGVTMAVVECGVESRSLDLNSLRVVPTLVEQQQEAPAEPSPDPNGVTRSLFPGPDEGSIASGLEDDTAEKLGSAVLGRGAEPPQFWVLLIWLEPGISHVTWVHYDATMCLACLVCSVLPVLHFLRFCLFVL